MITWWLSIELDVWGSEIDEWPLSPTFSKWLPARTGGRLDQCFLIG